MRFNRESFQPVELPLQTDLVWIAGFLEGEGCFSYHGKYGEVSATHADVDNLYYIRDKVGGSVHLRKPGPKSKKPLYQWRVAGAKARALMAVMYPLVSNRRQIQIEDATWFLLAERRDSPLSEF